MMLLGRKNWSKLSGKNLDPQVSKETEKQVLLPLLWFLLLPSPPQGCSRDSAMSHKHSPGFGGLSHFTQKPDCEVNNHRHDIMFPRVALTHFPGQ